MQNQWTDVSLHGKYHKLQAHHPCHLCDLRDRLTQVRAFAYTARPEYSLISLFHRNRWIHDKSNLRRFQPKPRTGLVLCSLRCFERRSYREELQRILLVGPCKSALNASKT